MPTHDLFRILAVTLLLATALGHPLAFAGNVPPANLILRSGFESPSVEDIRPMSDRFDNAATLGDWRRIWRDEYWSADQLEGFDIATTRAGWMTMLPHASTWYQDYRGELTYKAVNGDFIATTRVESRNRSGTGAPGSTLGGSAFSEYSLAGILVRAPRVDMVCCDPSGWQQGRERYVFLSYGSADQTGSYQFEVKTTRAAVPPESHSISTLEISDTDATQVDLRVARIGPALIMLLREQGAGWRAHRRYRRDDFPESLQVGMTVYTDWEIASTYPFAQHNNSVITHAWQDPGTPAAPDLRAQFDFFHFDRPLVPMPLQGVDLTDAALVNDAQLLAFLGDAVP